MKESSGSICPLCKGKKVPGTTTFTVDLGYGILVVRDVPALVCSQCGTDWIVNDVAANLEDVVENARMTRRQVEVTAYAAQTGSRKFDTREDRRVSPTI